MYGKMSKAVHCEQADIAKNFYHKFDDSFLNPHLSKDYESFDFNWYYYKKCYNKLCDKSFVGRAVARTLIGGVYIHIFRLCRLVSFEIKLILKELSRASPEYMNIHPSN